MQKETPARVQPYPRHQNRVIICKNAIDTGRKCEFIMAHIPYQLALALNTRVQNKQHIKINCADWTLRRARLYCMYYTLLFH